MVLREKIGERQLEVNAATRPSAPEGQDDEEKRQVGRPIDEESF
jgi:hypothetical protein